MECGEKNIEELSLQVQACRQEVWSLEKKIRREKENDTSRSSSKENFHKEKWRKEDKEDVGESARSYSRKRNRRERGSDTSRSSSRENDRKEKRRREDGNTRMKEKNRRPGRNDEIIRVRTSRNGNTGQFKEMVVRLSVGTKPKY